MVKTCYSGTTQAATKRHSTYKLWRHVELAELVERVDDVTDEA